MVETAFGSAEEFPCNWKKLCNVSGLHLLTFLMVTLPQPPLDYCSASSVEVGKVVLVLSEWGC